MFLPALMNHGTGEQQAEWVSRAWNCNVIGTYAQTELGHGTFLRGLETTSTYDPKTKEFVIHSPSITAYKVCGFSHLFFTIKYLSVTTFYTFQWWPGGLGHTANYAIVIAQLYSQGEHHGIQPFIVQLRDEETHMPMKGITIGEIGNKVGMNTVNNGFLGFNQVRIPLKHMLMKNAKVLENGEFIKPKSSVLTYGTMMFVRVVILKDMASYLSKAVTIAMRYATVRRQSPIDPKQPEPKIIEHVTQQMKIFPAIAKVIVFKLTAEFLWEMYNQVTHELDKGNLERLPELHAIACCLKAVCTNESTQAVQTCRLACGGHGYLNSAGFDDIYGSVTAAQTYEGENTVLFLQTARYLVKAWSQAVKGEKLTPTVAYLKNYVNQTRKGENFDGSPAGILRALQATAAGKVAMAYKHLEARKKICSPEQAANQTSIELAAASEVHCQVFLLQSAVEMLESAAKSASPALAVVLRDVLELYAVDLAFRSLGNLLQFVNITAIDIEKLQGRLEAALKKFKNNAIGIVDAFDIPDEVLGSVLGAYDGNVYERLLNAAKKSPLNQEDVNKSFHLHLKPFMKSNL
jgi:acyl-CoA oxidase